MTSRLLDIEKLTIRAKEILVNEISFWIDSGETVALVGESGSGKTVTAHAIIQLLSASGLTAHSNHIFFNGIDLTQASEKMIRNLRGQEIGFIPQNPLSSLNPTLTIGFQVMEAIRKETKQKRTIVCDMLYKVGFPDPEKQMRCYPHELSGGMRQRVLIAMALINNPKLVIADEPTTALDMTIQAQILDVLCKLKKEYNMSLLFITHDLGIVAQIADRVIVMYKGQIVEVAHTTRLFYSPEHPYTQSLLATLPQNR